VPKDVDGVGEDTREGGREVGELYRVIRKGCEVEKDKLVGREGGQGGFV
jgi:hypothetical protein